MQRVPVSIRWMLVVSIGSSETQCTPTEALLVRIPTPSPMSLCRAQYEGISRMQTSLRRRHRDRVVRRGLAMMIESGETQHEPTTIRLLLMLTPSCDRRFLCHGCWSPALCRCALSQPSHNPCSFSHRPLRLRPPLRASVCADQLKSIRYCVQEVRGEPLRTSAHRGFVTTTSV